MLICVLVAYPTEIVVSIACEPGCVRGRVIGPAGLQYALICVILSCDSIVRSTDRLAAIECSGGFKIARDVFACCAHRLFCFEELFEVFAFYVLAPAKAINADI